MKVPRTTFSELTLKYSLKFSFQLARDDGLPQQICDECLKNLLNIQAFRKVCEQSHDVLERFFKASTESTSSVPIKLIADLSESNFSDFEFLSIDNVEDTVEYGMKIEVRSTK